MVMGSESAYARRADDPTGSSLFGHEAIQAYWLNDEGLAFTVTAEPVAVEGRDAVVRLEVRYSNPDQEYRDLWILRFAPDGRVEHFEEWAYWPDKTYVAPADSVS